MSPAFCVIEELFDSEWTLTNSICDPSDSTCSAIRAEVLLVNDSGDVELIVAIWSASMFDVSVVGSLLMIVCSDNV